MELVTPRTIMIKYKTSDFDAFCEVICNDEVMLYISGKGNSKEVARKKFDRLLKTNQENEFYGIYKVCLIESDTLIGFAKIVPFETEEIEIGYALTPSFWRMGYTLELIEKMTSHCLKYFSDKKIMAIVNIDNIGSLKVLEKCNFKKYQQKIFKGAPCFFLEYKN